MKNTDYTKDKRFMIKYKDFVEAQNSGKIKIEAYMIKHSTELRFFTKFEKDSWKQWSLSLAKAAIFTDLDYALGILNKLNEERIKCNPNDKREYKIIKTSSFI